MLFPVEISVLVIENCVAVLGYLHCWVSTVLEPVRSSIPTEKSEQLIRQILMNEHVKYR